MLRTATPERLSTFSDAGVCRSDHRLGLGSPAALQGAPVALAYMAELRSQLRFHRNCLG